MSKIAGLDYITFQFDKKGRRLNAGDPIVPPGCSDLIVISHGWHSNPDESQAFYEELFGNVAATPGWLGGRKVVVAGVFWPSDKFRDDLGEETRSVLGGAAASAGGELADPVLMGIVGDLKKLLDINDPKFDRRVLRAANGGADADDLVTELRALVADGPVDAQTKFDHQDLLNMKGSDILVALEQQGTPNLAGAPAQPAGTATSMGAGASGAGGAAAGLFSGAKAAIAKLLNQFAYFELKKRSGRIGEQLGQLLNGAAGIGDVRLHLIGHSFGARLVTSAANVLDKPAQSMTLLQAAFSHNSFADSISYGLHKNIHGGFRDVIVRKKVRGPIAVTHTWHDTAVGLAYPAASRVSGVVASGIGVSPHFGGAEDAYGGLGANGALGLPSAEGSSVLFDGSALPSLASGHVTNLKCEFIKGHTDVANTKVALVVAAATR